MKHDRPVLEVGAREGPREAKQNGRRSERKSREAEGLD